MNEHINNRIRVLVVLIAIFVVGWMFYPHFQQAINSKSADYELHRAEIQSGPSSTISEGDQQGLVEEDSTVRKPITVYHSFRDGWHTYFGTILSKSSCGKVKAQATVIAAAGSNEAVIALNSDKKDEGCIKEPTPQVFTVAFPAKEDIDVRALFNNRPVRLIVRESLDGVKEFAPTPQ